MATNFCLPPAQADKFKAAILRGEIDPIKLSEMSSAERHKFFAERFGEDGATHINRDLERTLLLKNQQEGMINWARRMMGSNKAAQRDVITKVQNLKELLHPEQEKRFMEDLVAARLGTRISYEEAKNIADLSAKIDETKAAIENGGDRLDYGHAIVAMRNYVAGLKAEAGRLSLEEAKRKPVTAIGKVISGVAGNAKAIKASLDDSAIFRQGWKTLWTHPEIWQRNARQSFVNLVKAFGSDAVMNELNADIYSRPTYPLMQQAKLAVGIPEEAYPTSLPEKIPGVGRVYRATEHAYNAFVQKTRADVFDKYIDIAQKADVPLDKHELESIGKLVNSLTGRGHLGKLEPVANTVNNVFFSPRMVKSHIDTLTMHATDDMSSFARKQAAINLLKIIGGTAAVLAVAKAVNPRSVETDPRSSDFGKIRVGSTRFDVSAGMGSLATLVAREIAQSTKSATSGKVSELNSGKFGSQTGTEVLYNFFENKLSPAASVLKDLIEGQTFEGEKPTVANELVNLFEPLPLKTFEELQKDPNAANTLVGMIADGLGIATNTFGPRIDEKASKMIGKPVVSEMQRLGVNLSLPERKAGETDEEFRVRRAGSPGAKRQKEESEKDFETRLSREGTAINADVSRLMLTPKYKSAPDDEKREMLRSAITAARRRIK